MAKVKTKDNKKFKEILDNKVKVYYEFLNRDDSLDKICVRREVARIRDSVFTLAEFLFNTNYITWEECCEYWVKVGVLDAEERCKATSCSSNNNGFCKFYSNDDDFIG